MKHFTLDGKVRKVGNKAVIKAFRKEGLVPCNLYGQGIDNVLFTVTAKQLGGLLCDPASYIIDIVLDNGEKYTATVHELQFHPVKDNCLHVDFLKVSEDKPVVIEIPVQITGHAIGVQQGGKFRQALRKLKVCALQKDLPDVLPIDITSLGLDKKIRARDLSYDGLTIITQPDTVVCMVKATRNAAAAAATAETAEAAE